MMKRGDAVGLVDGAEEDRSGNADSAGRETSQGEHEVKGEEADLKSRDEMVGAHPGGRDGSATTEVAVRELGSSKTLFSLSGAQGRRRREGCGQRGKRNAQLK